MAHIVKVVGPAGTGKTTYILREIEKLQQEGLSLMDIGFFSFSRQALAAMSAKLGMGALPPWFRTFHSLGAYLKASGRKRLINKDDWERVIRSLHLTTPAARYGELMKLTEGAIGYAHNAGITFSKALEVQDLKGIPLSDVYKLQAAIFQYQKDNQRVSFPDMLDLRGVELPDLPAVFFDEAQDLSYAQVQIVNRLIANCKNAWVVGDPNQAIYGWAGNSQTWLEDFKADETHVLPRSYRLPKSVLRFSQAIIDRIGTTYDFLPKDEEGSVDVIEDYTQLPYKNGESWMILLRNNFHVGRIVKTLSEKDIQPYPLGRRGEVARFNDLRKLEGLFAYERILEEPDESGMSPLFDAIYRGLGIRAKQAAREGVSLETGCGLSPEELQRLRKLQATGGDRISIGTFHSSKGLEADNVVIFTECNVKQKVAWNRNERGEVCPYYVAATRAAKRIYLVASKKGYPYVF